MILYYRRKVILSILEKIGKEVTAKCLQKYLFIFTRMQYGEKIYDFVPYKYGCFSFQANQDIVTLRDNGFLYISDNVNNECSYKLTSCFNMINQLDIFDSQAINKIYEEFGSMTQEELIRYTYQKWPFTAINSVIKHELLNKEELKIIDKEKEKFLRNDSSLMTIGYEGLTLEKYLKLLITNDVKVLCDVRKNAYSMKYGFSKGILQKSCEGLGIKYIHIPELGIDSNKRKSLKTQKDYDELFENYERTSLKDNFKYVLKIRDILDSEKRVCLTCFEKDPRQCHRTRIAHALMNLDSVNYKLYEIIL